MTEQTQMTMNEPDNAVALSVENLTKTYSNGTVTAVDDISFTVQKGSIVGLLGPNGAGKTSTIKSIIGTLVPDSGDVEICGVSLADDPQWVHDNVGVMFEGSRDAYWRLTVRENLEFFTRLNGVPASRRRHRHDELLKKFGLFEKADVPVRKLSRGMKQKVALASTLAQDIELAFLDEPTLGLDVETSLKLRDEIRSLVETRDLTVVLTSHDLDVIEDLCDRVIVLLDGRKVADDTVPNLLELFQNDVYQVRLGETNPEEALSALRSQFDIVEYETRREMLEFRVELHDKDIHQLSDSLREIDCSVESLELTSPDLSRIFLDITNEPEVHTDV